MAPATNLLISGGPGHDFAASSAALADVLVPAGITSVITEDPRAAIARLEAPNGGIDMVTVNALRWRMEIERYRDARRSWAFELTDHEAATLDGFVRRGGALLAAHTAVICFDAEPRWAALLGATWDWDRSSHPALGTARIEPTEAGRHHPITAGVAAFSTTDEVYRSLRHHDAIEPLLTSTQDGVAHPVLWARTLGNGRVVTDLLGHDAAAMAHTDHAHVLRQSARWLLDTTPGATP